MKFIGITGGIGAGKSTVLSFIQEKYSARVVLADQLAAELTGPQGRCFPLVKEAFAGENIVTPEGGLNRAKMAELIFSDEEKRARMNAIVHPAVKEEILSLAERERRAGTYQYLFFEAALLLEDGYDLLCDQLWYIYAGEETRRRRLRENRGYTDEKIQAIFARQLPEKTFRSRCQVVIDNDGEPERAYEQIRKLLGSAGEIA